MLIPCPSQTPQLCKFKVSQLLASCCGNKIFPFNAHQSTTFFSTSVLQAAGTESTLKNHPHPEAKRDMVLDLKHQSVKHHSDRMDRGQANNASTGSSLSNSHRWSDSTLTGSVSGQYSTYSWGLDEAVS